jgi:hypothetical protein
MSYAFCSIYAGGMLNCNDCDFFFKFDKKRGAEYLIEEAFITCSTLAGAIFGTAVIPKLYKRTKASAKEGERLIKPYELAKSELESLQFEKSLLYEAITRVYEAVQEGRIDTMERDRLLLKYKRQLATYNEKIDALRPLVDFSELSDMRDDVVNLLEKRITAIDQRLAELSKKSGISHTDFPYSKSKMSIQQSPPIMEWNNWQQEQEVGEGARRKKEKETRSVAEHDYYASHRQYASGEEQKNKKNNILYKGEQISEYISEGKNIEKLEKEIMEALCRLEQTGVNNNNDNEYDNRNEGNNNNDKSATYQYMGISSNTTDRSCLRQLR